MPLWSLAICFRYKIMDEKDSQQVSHFNSSCRALICAFKELFVAYNFEHTGHLCWFWWCNDSPGNFSSHLVTWCFKPPAVENCLAQISHWYGCFPSWTVAIWTWKKWWSFMMQSLWWHVKKFGLGLLYLPNLVSIPHWSYSDQNIEG